MAFTGFPAAAATFYDGLAADNSRAWWLAHKEEYERTVRGPMEALLDDLADFGPFHVFRPNRDVRFAKDKTPYKDHIGAYGESEGGTGHYVQFSATGLFAGSGYYHMAADQLERFRTAVDDDVFGPRIAAIVDALTADGFEAGAIDALKTAPRGYPKDHPRIELLRRKSVAAIRSWEPAAWFGTRGAATKITGVWRAAAPLNTWLVDHVGPSTAPPDSRW